MKYHLHYGLPTSQIDEALEVIAATFEDSPEAERPRLIAEGDGWFSWGDPIGQAGNDDTTAHVIVAFVKINDALDAHRAMAEAFGSLVHYVTTAEDWSEHV